METSVSEQRRCQVTVKALDFEAKTEKPISHTEAPAVMDAGGFVWVDLHIADDAEAAQILKSLGVIGDEMIERVLEDEATSQVFRYPECLHLVMISCRAGDTRIQLERLDAMLGERFFLTIYREPVGFLESLRREYYDDFLRHAKSPSFFIYELWDFLLAAFTAMEEAAEARVSRLQEELIERVNEDAFRRVSELGRDLVELRSVLLPARAALEELSTRRSSFISPETQPFLANMVAALDRILGDIIAAREILSDTLNVHMSMVAYRTNEVVKRLTIVSMVFLPLTVLVGVYGMNFPSMPILGWAGYEAFWGAAGGVVCVSLIVMRVLRIL